jgi:hypothetical protein
MANPVATYAYTIDPPRRTGGGPILDAEPVRAGPSRPRPAPLRLVHDAGFVRVRESDTAAARGRTRLYDATDRSAGFGTEADETLRDAGRRRAPPGLSFTAQQIAQEVLSPGLYFENYRPALAAYGLAARHGEPSPPPVLSLSV